MKVAKIFCVMTLTFFLILSLSLGAEQERESETVREEVSVMNIEVPVRVLLNGLPVDRLTKSDFELYEGQKQREINGFFIKRKKIKIPVDKQVSQETIFPSRYFVLVFHIQEFNEHLTGGLKYIFEKILNPNDRLMVLVFDRTLFYANLRKKEQALAEITSSLKEQSRQVRNRQRKLRVDLRGITPIGEESDARAFDYLNKYWKIFRDYKKNYLQPEMSRLYQFAAHLDSIKQEKWVLNFYQEESFPHLGQDQKDDIMEIVNESMVHDGHQSHDARRLHRLLLRIENDLNAADDFPAGDIHKLFSRTGATFHSLLIPTLKPASFRFSNASETRGFEYKRISTDYENSLREITKKTGGAVIFSKDLVSSLQTIEEKEDICYWLTFSPRDPHKIGKVRVKVRGSNYKLVYDNNMQPDYLSAFIEKKEGLAETVLLKNVSFSNRRLSLLVTGFQPGRDSEKSGLVSLRIRVNDSKNNNLFDEQKTLLPRESSIKVSIPFSRLAAGRYHVLIDARDLNTGKSAFKLLETTLQ